MPERPSSDRGSLFQLGVVGALAAALGVSYCNGRAEACSDDPSEATHTSTDLPEAGEPPIAPTLRVRFTDSIAAIPDEDRRIRAETDLINKAVNFMMDTAMKVENNL